MTTFEVASSSYNHPYSNPELEDEGEYFFKKAFRTLGKGLKSVAKAAAPLAKQFAPILAGKLAAMIPIPGAGLIAGPLARNLTSQLLKEGELEAEQLESELFGNGETELANTEIAHEAALTEFLAAQAAEATTQAEAEAAIASSLPISFRVMGGRLALRPVMPVMAQATGRMTHMMLQRGPNGQQLVRTIPTIHRQTAATLKAIARSGHPINNATAVKALADSAHRVLSNPQRVENVIVRNAHLRQLTARPSSQRPAKTCRCPVCSPSTKYN